MKSVRYMLIIFFSIHSICMASVIKISEKEVIKLTLDNSIDIKLIKLDMLISKQDLSNVLSLFDLYLNADTSYTNNKLVSTLSGDAFFSKIYDNSLGFSKKFATGTTAEITYESDKTKSNSAALLFAPYFENQVSLSIVQNLANNAFGLSDKASIKETKIDIENEALIGLDNIEEAVYNACLSYWNIVLNEANFSIIKNMLEYSTKQLKIYDEKLELGSADAADYQAVYSLYLQRMRDLNISKISLQNSKNTFFYTINLYSPNSDIHVLDKLDKIKFAKKEQDKEIKIAMKNRRDYQQLLNQAKKNKIEIKRMKNSLLPIIDLTATYTSNGIRRNFDDSFEDAFSRDDNQYYVGLSFSIPWENRLAKSDLQKKNYEKQQLVLKIKKKEKEIITDIVNKSNDYNILIENIILAKNIMQAEMKKLKHEEKKIKQGRSNVDILVRYQMDLMNANLNYKKLQYELIITERILRKLQNVLM